jgi:hypothetical protein
MEKLIKIELTIAKWNVVMKGVGNLPFVEVSEIIAEMKQQADPQLLPEGMQTPETSEVQPS